MVGRKRSRVAKETTPTLTVHQIVAHNFTRARQAAGWTQVETSERLEPFLGYRLNQAGVSAIEKTYDSERRRTIDVAEIVAFARCFGVPIGWFFLPPPGHGGDLVGPVYHDDRYDLPAAELLPLSIATPAGWNVYLRRLRELLDTDRRPVANALAYALDGRHDPDNLAGQLNLRRRAIQNVTLARHATPADEVIQDMARLLVRLVSLTPIGLNKLRELDP
ncbi:MAG: helix-turn-helix domain-containing protein, partial [Ilumatobacteraceae bacterium]